MRNRETEEQRAELLKDVSGCVLEIGFGSGLNLDFYPEHVRHITAVDPNPGVTQLAAQRIARSSIQVEHHQLGGEKMPFPDGVFDSAVSTFTLCSIPGLAQSLGEVRRVLKPSGRFFFVEHGLAPAEDKGVRRWQHWLTPLQKKIGDGCHLDRDIAQAVETAGFRIERLDRFYARPFGRPFSFLYRGVAVPA